MFFWSSYFFFFFKNFFQLYQVSLDPGQGRCFVGPDLSPNDQQRFISRQQKSSPAQKKLRYKYVLIELLVAKLIILR